MMPGPVLLRLRRAPGVPALAAVVAALLVPAGAGAAWGSELKPGKVAEGKFTPGRPPAARFGEDPALSCQESSVARTLEKILADQAKAAKKDPPRPEGRLCAIAEALLGWDPKGEPPGERVMTFLSQYFGVTARVTRPLLGEVPGDDSREVADRLAEHVANATRAATVPRYGIATQREGAYRPRAGGAPATTRVVVVALDEPVAADPIPRRLAPGEKARISGKVLGDLEKPRLVLSDVLGRLSTPPPSADASFQAEIACGDKPGWILVEIDGELGGSPTVAARFPVACGGVALATSVPLVDPSPWPPELEKQARRTFDEINAERTAVGIPALAWDQAVADVAQGLSESIRAEVRRGSLDVPGDVIQRLRKVGIGSTLVLQNPVQSPNAATALRQLLESPRHRANIMNPEVNKAGVGIVAEPGKDGASSVFVTQLLIKELPPLDPVEVRGKLRAAMERKRKDARQPPVTFDAALDQVAEKYARELAAAGGELSKARKAELTAPLGKSYKTVNVLSGARGDPLDFAEEPEVVSAGKFAGVGVALGMHPTLGRNAVYAVILVASKR